MRPLRYTINVTLDGCVDHRDGIPDAELHQHALEGIEQADAMVFGRVTYQMMEEAWRGPAVPGRFPEWTNDFRRTIDAARKYVVSSTLPSVDWNAELLRGDLATAVRRLKQQPGGRLATGGVTLPRALAELDLIDEYEILVHPRLVGHGPTLLSGLPRSIDLRLVERSEFRSGTVVLRYEVKR